MTDPSTAPGRTRTRLRAVAVYCGSSPGARESFAEGAAALGRALARRDIRLVYGGGRVGLMGVIADTVLAEGGEVHGVITRALMDREVGHGGLTRLDVVETMHDRKALMADLVDGFVMLPGGFGTLDEFFEALTWTQLGIHTKPCGIVDVDGYFAPLIQFMDRAVAQRFVAQAHRDMVVTAADADQVLDLLAAWQPPDTSKWLDRSER
ncbi:TIGR00730 family Rossman fold protein [Euzebya sp.]|uniref:LOG family protein n=1 Tax=Euzebya sp. TaxID=1971409 RepID=UPI003516217E